MCLNFISGVRQASVPSRRPFNDLASPINGKTNHIKRQANGCRVKPFKTYLKSQVRVAELKYFCKEGKCFQSFNPRG